MRRDVLPSAVRGWLVIGILLFAGLTGCARESAGGTVAMVSVQQYPSGPARLDLMVATFPDRPVSAVEPGDLERFAKDFIAKLDRVENATAEITAASGPRVVRVDNITFDETNGSIVGWIDTARFTAVNVSATFVLEDGSRVDTSEVFPASATVTMPWRLRLEAFPMTNATSVVGIIYEMKPGRVGFSYAYDSPESNSVILLAPRIAAIEEWVVTARRGSGEEARVDEYTFDGTSSGNIHALVHATDLVDIDASFRILLDDGTRITRDDVEVDRRPSLPR